MEIAIGTFYDVLSKKSREEAIEWCRECIRLRIENDGLKEGEDYLWKDLYVEEGADGVVYVRLPLIKIL